jgi:hypothetical protein
LWESLTYIVIKTEVIYYLVIEFLFFMDVDKIIYIFGNWSNIFYIFERFEKKPKLKFYIQMYFEKLGINKYFVL